MNTNLPHLPERPNKERTDGITMVMDKGLSVKEAENLIDACGHLIDYAKLGFGTSVITNNIEQKIKLYKEANIYAFNKRGEGRRKL